MGDTTSRALWQRLARDRDGGVLPVFVFMLTLMLSLGALAIDGSHGFLMRDRLQATADAAALAGVSQLPSVTSARATAISYAEKNLPSGTNGTVLNTSDVVVGSWAGGTFTPGGAAQNALQVTVRRDQVNNNRVPTFLANVVGVSHLDVVATASAFVDLCYMRGVIARGHVQIDQNATADAGTCIYGRNSVHFDQDAVVDPGAKVGSLDRTNITFDQNGSYGEGSLVGANLAPKLADHVADIIDNLENGTLVPPQINNVVVTNSLPDNLMSGTVYVVNGTLTVEKSYSATDVIIAVRGNVDWGKKGAITNTASGGSGVSVGVLATGTIELGQSAIVSGATLVAGDDMIFNQNSVATDVAVQAGRDVHLAQNFSLNSSLDFPIPGFRTAPVRLIN